MDLDDGAVRGSDRSMIRLDSVKRSFGSNLVLDGVDFELLPGEIHTLCGEGGAGKSTCLGLAGALSVAENIYTGRAPARLGVVDWAELRRRAQALLAVHLLHRQNTDGSKVVPDWKATRISPLPEIVDTGVMTIAATTSHSSSPDTSNRRGIACAGPFRKSRWTTPGQFFH